MIRECITAEQALAFARAWDQQAAVRRESKAHWSVVQYAEQQARFFYKRAELMMEGREKRDAPPLIPSSELVEVA